MEQEQNEADGQSIFIIMIFFDILGCWLAVSYIGVTESSLPLTNKLMSTLRLINWDKLVLESMPRKSKFLESNIANVPVNPTENDSKTNC